MVLAAPGAAPGFSSPVARMQAIRTRFGAAATETATTSASDFAALLAAADPTGPLSALLGSANGGTSLLGALGASGAVGGADATAAGSGTAGQDVVDIAMDYQGIPYVWGGTDPAKGLDCSGFLQHVFGRLGVDLPRVSRDQAKQGVAVASLDQAKPGDIIAFGQPVDHISIYVGDGKIIHAPRTGDVVKVADLHRTPTAIRRLVPDTSSASGGLSGVGAGSIAAAGRTSLAPSAPALAQYSSLFASAGQRYGISANLLAAVAKVESGGNANAVSSAGARGLMQFMPGTAQSMGIDPSDPAQAIDGAARLLTRLRDSFGTTELALAAYNAGEGAVRRAGGIPPYGETQAYVSKVMALLGGAT